MSKEPFFICSDCGSSVLAISHTWTKNAVFEQVGSVQEGGVYSFDKTEKTGETEDNHEWIAYCGGCGKGVTVEWLSDDRVKILLRDSS
jgi:hypothetical protein